MFTECYEVKDWTPLDECGDGYLGGVCDLDPVCGRGGNGDSESAESEHEGDAWELHILVALSMNECGCVSKKKKRE